MTQLLLKTSIPKLTNADTAIADNGTIRTGAGFRLPPAEIADSARVRVGAGFRLPTA